MTEQPAPSRSQVDLSDVRGELDRLTERLDPRRNRREAITGFERLFRSGIVPEPWPAGPLEGRLLGTTIWGPWDAVVSRLASWWMPWMGKSFDPDARTGLNRFRATEATRLWLKVLFPGYRPELDAGVRIEAFPFRNWVGAGAMDPEIQVLKIDYDFEPNPALIRRILDELVQIAPGLYLGKVLLRLGSRYRRIGFFSLAK